MESGNLVLTMKQALSSPHQDLQIFVELAKWTGSPEYEWRVTTKIADHRLDTGEGLPQTVRGLKSAVELIERWPSGMVPGELSQEVYSEEYSGGLTTSTLTAKARDQHRWIEYRGSFDRTPSVSINLSTSQALHLAEQLEKAPQAAQDMIAFLKSSHEI